MNDTRQSLHIGYGEGVALLVTYIGVKVFTSCPSQFIYLLSTASWIAAGFAAVPAALGMTATYYFVVRFRGLSFQRCLEATIGRFFGKALGVVYLAFLVFLNAVPIREFSGAFKTALLPGTPLNAIAAVGSFIVSAAPAVFGLEALGRMGRIVVYPLGALTLFIVLGSMRIEFSIAEVFPMWGTGVRHTLLGSIPCSSLYAEGIGIGFLMPYIRETRRGEGLRLAMVSLGLSAAAFTVVVFTSIAVFTAAVSAQLLYPMLQLARMFTLVEFLERLDPLFVFAWVILASLRVTLGNLLSAMHLADILGVRRWSAFVWPLAAATYYLALWPPTLVDVFVLQVTFFRSVGWIVAFVFPSILLGIASLRGVPDNR